MEYAGVSWREGRSSPAYRKYLLLPYLDLDTLTKNPAALLGLLHTRAKDAPAEWASYDHEQLRSPWGIGLLDATFNECSVVMFCPRYGTYAKWQKNAAHRFDIIGFPCGRLVMEAQATLLAFLRRVVEQLLVGGVQVEEPVSMGCTRWNTNIDSGLKMVGDAAAWSKFVQTPFTAPPYFDVDALVALVKTRVTATGDHLALLQTEAPYFKHYMQKLYQMQTVESASHRNVAITIINWEIVEDINVHWFWRSTLLEFEHLQEMYNRFRDSTTTGEALPKKVDQALGALELVLVNAIHERSQQLQAIISQRPGFRENYVYGATTMNAKGLCDTTYQVKRLAADDYEGNAAIYREQRLWWILLQLQGEPDSQTRFRYAMLLDMLDDHLANASFKERARLDEILDEKLSDYATLLELLLAVRLHCPRNSNRTIKDCEQTEDRLTWRVSKVTKNPQMPDTAATVNALKFLRSIDAPAGPRNRKWLQQFDRTHSALQAFWREMSASLRSTYTRNGYAAQDIEYSMEPLQAWNDPEHMARLAQNRAQVEADIQKPKLNESGQEFLPFPNAFTTSPKSDILQQAKKKPKTRGLPHSEASEQVADVPEVPATAVKTIQLSKSPYTALRSMFPSTVEERRKSLDWSVFVNSMKEAGFMARNGGGSIVRFESRNGDGSINFHRPHPNPTIDPIMLQAMGWRMNKWFGWVRETFVLAKK